MRLGKIGFLFFILVVVAFMGWYFIPPVMDWFYVKKSFKEAGLNCKILQVGKERFSYAEGGSGETLLCFHGFASDKKAWVVYAQDLRKNYHVIAVDLPSHGGSLTFPDQHFDLYSIAQKIHVFVKGMNLSSFHLMGTSMGGGVAVAYSLFYPQEVSSLILVNPLGVPFEKNDFLRSVEKGKNPLLPRTTEELDDCFTFLTGKPLSYSYPFKAYIVRKLEEKYSFYEKAFNELVHSHPLTPFLSHIRIKTLLLVGEKDRVISPVSYKVFQEKLPNVSCVHFSEGSHVLLGPYQKQAIQSISHFLQGSPLPNEVKR
jgi:pimeloyl-ACP methyl ester carboxylesterase